LIPLFPQEVFTMPEHLSQNRVLRDVETASNRMRRTYSRTAIYCELNYGLLVEIDVIAVASKPRCLGRISTAVEFEEKA